MYESYFVLEILMDNLFACSHASILPISALTMYSNVWASLDDINKRLSSANNLTLKSEHFKCYLYREERAMGQRHYLAALHKQFCIWLIHDDLFEYCSGLMAP